MKLISIATWLSAAALSFSVHAAPAKAGTYAIDQAHSTIGFDISHMVISSVDGRFKNFEGSITVADKFEKSNVKANVDVNSIDTGNGKRDEHLKSPDFFDVAKFSKMTFESTSIKGSPESFKMEGKLTLHGVTKPVTFDGKYMGAINDGMGNDKVAFTASAKINRKDFGLAWNKAIEAGPIVGDELTISIKIEAGHPAAKK